MFLGLIFVISTVIYFLIDWPGGRTPDRNGSPSNASNSTTPIALSPSINPLEDEINNKFNNTNEIDRKDEQRNREPCRLLLFIFTSAQYCPTMDFYFLGSK